MTEIIEPGYAAAIVEVRRRLDRNIAIAERAVIATTIIDEKGEPFRPMRDDLRLRTADLDNRARAKAMMETVLAETARHGHLDPEQRRAADEFVRGIAENERSQAVRRAPLQDPTATQSGALVPARHLPDLSESEVADRLRASSRLADKRAEIENLSRLVLGSSQAVSGAVARITDARSGAAAGTDVRAGRLGDMAGEGGNGCGVRVLSARRRRPTRRGLRQPLPIMVWRWISSGTRSSRSTARSKRGNGWKFHDRQKGYRKC
ncbi:hypothetical protein O3W52_00440 [Ensifer psoraleae]|uniref:DUF222 domain-containing protein n=2 Tax=Sinorhizobium psoraleae TaxID=520838 RepID=A0ABT4KA00_9HYPH|nr:hypothetical protein [Sinorhizobium psoraleae]